MMKYLACYLIGALPFSVIFSSIFLKQDIRLVGSGNIGTSNAYRVGGAKFAFAIALLDIAKGYLAMKYFSPESSLWMLLVVVGQMFPIFLAFKGGKGVGVYIGSLIALNPTTGAMLGGLWIITTKLIKQPFIASFLVLTASIFLYPNNYYKSLVIILILLKHAENVKKFFRQRR